MTRQTTHQDHMWREAVKAAHIAAHGELSCVMCGTTDGPFHADHVKPVAKHPELRHEVSNGVVLCATHNLQKGAKEYARLSYRDESWFK